MAAEGPGFIKPPVPVDGGLRPELRDALAAPRGAGGRGDPGHQLLAGRPPRLTAEQKRQMERILLAGGMASAYRTGL